MKQVYVLESSEDVVIGVFSTLQKAIEYRGVKYEEVDKNMEWQSDHYRILCFPIDK